MDTDQYGNLYSDYMPTYLRKHYLKRVDEYDKEWQPWLMKMIPKKVGPGDGSKSYFTRPKRADPQGMATYQAPDEAVIPMNRGTVSEWNYHTRMLANGFTKTRDEFKEDFEGDFLSRAQDDMLRFLTEFINRSIEYTLTRFAYGDTNVVGRFTDQTFERQGIVDLAAGTFNGDAASDLEGTSWNDAANALPHDDIAFMKERYKYMANKRPAYLAIGRRTEFKLETNDDVKDRMIRVENAQNEILGDYLAGINLVKVVGQTYKDDPSAANNIGMPGAGDYTMHTWDNANKHDMMTETIGGNTWEWGIMGGREIGEVSCGWVDEDHRTERNNPTEIFIEQWDERNPKQVWTTAKMSICPVVYDYANIMLVRRMAQQL